MFSQLALWILSVSSHSLTIVELLISWVNKSSSLSAIFLNATIASSDLLTSITTIVFRFLQYSQQLPINFLHCLILLDHFHNLEVAHLLPLVVIPFQYVSLTFLSAHVSPLIDVLWFVPLCSVDFHHSPFLHYSFCNVPDASYIWCLFSKFPYCSCIASCCNFFPLFFCFPLFMIIYYVFVCYCTFGHTSSYAAIDWFITNAANIFQSMSWISYWSFIGMLSMPASMSTARLHIWYLGNIVPKHVLHKNLCWSDRLLLTIYMDYFLCRFFSCTGSSKSVMFLHFTNTRVGACASHSGKIKDLSE